MAKKKFKVFIDHPCIMHIYMQDHLECLDLIPELVKNNDGSRFVKTDRKDFGHICYQVLNAVSRSGKFRVLNEHLFFEIYDAIHHDDELTAKLIKVRFGVSNV